MRTLRIVVLTLVIAAAVLAACFYFYFSHSTFSARQKPGWLETAFVEAAQELAMPRDAEKLKNPNQETPEILDAGREHFVEHCAVCHGPDGKGQTIIGEHVYPPVPDLTSKDSQEAGDGELFYIISDGIRFSGMPAFAATHSKDDIWHLVTFLRHLPKLTPAELEQMKKATEPKAGEHE